MRHLIIYIILFAGCGCRATAQDSLPPCIVHLSTKEPVLFYQYEYKGKQLFSFKTAEQLANEKKNISDKMVTTRYYDYNCQLFCTTIKGGVAGLNKIMPDSVEKTKIILVNTIVSDTIVAKKAIPAPALPDTIAQLFKQKKIDWIEEITSDGKRLFRFQLKTTNSKIVFAGPYYTESGAIGTTGKTTGKGAWWHASGTSFLRTQFRPGFK